MGTPTLQLELCPKERCGGYISATKVTYFKKTYKKRKNIILIARLEMALEKWDMQVCSLPLKVFFI